MEGTNTINDEVQAGPPHEALFLTLTYLQLLELLNMSGTCTSLRDSINKDVLPWLHITVNRPLSYRLSDEILLRYASKANGRLKSLNLNKCVKVTDEGLQQVAEQNPFIDKLHIPGCTNLTADGIITVVKTLSKHSHNLTSLKINGIYNINQEHLHILRSVLTTNLERKRANPHPFTSFKNEETDSLIDIDICPKCDQVRQVFQCTSEDCARKKSQGGKECRGCCYCVPRCVECTKCIDGEDEEEVDMACEDSVCFKCWLKLPKCSFCNRPYCKYHAELRYVHSGSVGFVCDGCVAMHTWPPYD